MLTVAQLKNTPHIFKELTGISLVEFNNLHAKVAPVWTEGERNRLSRRKRRRTIGGGRKYTLELQDQLLMSLMRLHMALNTEALGFFFGVDKSTVSRNARRMLTALAQLDRVTADWPEPPKRGRGKTIDQALHAYPELETLINEARQTGPLLAEPIPQKTLVPNQPAGQIGQSTIRTEFVAQSPPFQGLSPSELDSVSQAAYLRRVNGQAFFYHQGDPATTFYILVEGQVRLTEVTYEGHQLLVRFISPGEAIGIIAALENTVYPLAAEAVEDCVALAWNSRTLELLMERIPRIAINGLRLVSQRWNELEERYRELATERVERRIAQALLRLVRQVGRKVSGGILIDLPLTRQDLAEMTGTTLYTVSRILSRWEHENLVEAGRERVLIRNPHSLTRIAEDLSPAESPANSLS